MIIVIDSTSGMREPITVLPGPQYGDEILFAQWAEIPRPMLALQEVGAHAPRSPDSRTMDERRDGDRPAPSAHLSDPDFLARVYRSQR